MGLPSTDPGDKPGVMRFQKIIQRRIRRRAEGVDVVGDINAAISANVGERSSTSHVSSRSTVSAHSQERGDRDDETQTEERPDELTEEELKREDG